MKHRSEAIAKRQTVHVFDRLCLEAYPPSRSARADTDTEPQADFFRFANPVSPMRLLPNSKAVDGNGTGVRLTLSSPSVSLPERYSPRILTSVTLARIWSNDAVPVTEKLPGVS